MSNSYDFTLTFALPEDRSNPGNYLDALYEVGCDDALVGTGNPGSIALNFSRRAKSAENAIRQAILNVQTAIPDAALIELKPDLVGISDMAALLECSRQNVPLYSRIDKSTPDDICLLTFKDYVAIEDCHIHLCLSNPVGLSLLRQFYDVLIQHNQIGRFPDFNTTQLVIMAHQTRTINSVSSQGIMNIDTLTGVHHHAVCFPGHCGLHTGKGNRVTRTHRGVTTPCQDSTGIQHRFNRVDILHVIVPGGCTNLQCRLPYQ